MPESISARSGAIPTALWQPFSAGFSAAVPVDRSCVEESCAGFSPVGGLFDFVGASVGFSVGVSVVFSPDGGVGTSPNSGVSAATPAGMMIPPSRVTQPVSAVFTASGTSAPTSSRRVVFPVRMLSPVASFPSLQTA